MKTTTLSGVEYITMQADMASREGGISARLAHLFFQCATVPGTRTVEGWDALVLAAREADVTVGEAAEFGEG